MQVARVTVRNLVLSTPHASLGMAQQSTERILAVWIEGCDAKPSIYDSVISMYNAFPSPKLSTRSGFPEQSQRISTRRSAMKSLWDPIGCGALTASNGRTTCCCRMPSLGTAPSREPADPYQPVGASWPGRAAVRSCT